MGSRCMEWILIILSYILFVGTIPVSLLFVLKIVHDYERAVIFRLGRMRSGARGPGLLFILPCIDTYRCVDIRTASFDVPSQEVLTKDAVSVVVNAVIYCRVYNPLHAILQVQNYMSSTRLLAMTMLRNILGTFSLGDILTNREAIATTMQVNLDEATDPWGIRIERIEIKDVSLPIQLQRAMAAEAEAAREARAKFIAAEGELKASEALKQAAQVMSESPGSLQLRYLQTLNSIAIEKNSTIIFPLPLEFINMLGRK